MTLHSSVLLSMAVISACASREEQVVSVGAPEPVIVVPDPVAKGVPHGGAIRLVAVTEAGDAALTVDEINGVRLWPTLDGTRSPVPVALSSQPETVALARDGRDLITIVLDGAGSVGVTRLGRDGSVRGHAQLGGGQRYAEVVAVDGLVLARTTDHAIELYTFDGTLRSHVEVAHGERVVDIAARRGRAAAVVHTAESHELRWLAVGDTLRWEASHRLPITPAEGVLAIAPSRRRIATVDAGRTGLFVLDVDLMPVRVPGSQVTVDAATHTIGFTDDDTVGVAGSTIEWWKREDSSAPAADPWAVATPPPQTFSSAQTAAVADGQLVVPHNSLLSLTTTKQTRYLGWKDGGHGSLMSVGNQVAILTSGHQFNWLDEDLAIVRRLSLMEERRPSDPWVHGTVIGERHVLAQMRENNTTALLLVDADKPNERIEIVRFTSHERYEFSHGVLVVIEHDKLRRFRIDLATNTSVELQPSIKLPRASMTWLRAFDPEQADGLVAIAQGWENDAAGEPMLWLYRQVGARIEKSKVKSSNTTILRSDADGTYYVVDYADGPGIKVVRGNDVIARVSRPSMVMSMAMPIAIAPDGERFAYKSGPEVVMFDLSGDELWRKAVWGASSMAFAGDRLVVAAPGGYVAIEAATGEQVARECGWNFGLHEKPPEIVAIGFAPVCEDPVVQ